MQSHPPTIELARQIASRFLGEAPSSMQEQSGGLSGAKVWRVESARGTFALRQYPVEFPTEDRLRWLHHYLKEVRDRGCTLLPCPLVTSTGATWIKHESQLWELLTWVHGEPHLETNPSRELLVAATTALAELHLQSEQEHCHEKPHFGWGNFHAQGILERRHLLQDWITTDEVRLAERFAHGNYSQALAELFVIQRNALCKHRLELLARLDTAAITFVKIFPVLRDVQPAHVLFHQIQDVAQLQVAGFIDLGALRLDSAAADLARLLQRWRFTEPNWYAEALAAYHRIRPLTENERLVFEAYDYSARLLSGVQWLRWLVLEDRQFANHDLVEQHWQRIRQDLGRFLKNDTVFQPDT